MARVVIKVESVTFAEAAAIVRSLPRGEAAARLNRSRESLRWLVWRLREAGEDCGPLQANGWDACAPGVETNGKCGG